MVRLTAPVARRSAAPGRSPPSPLLLLALAAWQLGGAAWIHAKAALAQHLIASAWEGTKKDGAQAPVAVGRHASRGAPHGALARHLALRARGHERALARLRAGTRGRHGRAGLRGQQRDRRAPRHALRVPAPPARGRGDRRGGRARPRDALPRARGVGGRQARNAAPRPGRFRRSSRSSPAGPSTPSSPARRSATSSSPTALDPFIGTVLQTRSIP